MMSIREASEIRRQELEEKRKIEEGEMIIHLNNEIYLTVEELDKEFDILMEDFKKKGL